MNNENKVAHTITINLICEMKSYDGSNDFDYDVKPDLDGSKEIKLTPINQNTSFTDVDIVDKFVKHDSVNGDMREFTTSITANLELVDTDDNDFYVSINDIGEAVITPYAALDGTAGDGWFSSCTENKDAILVTEGADLNLVTEGSHFKVVTEGEDLDEDIEADGEPYTYEQVEADLKSLTMNWTREDTLKTTFEVEHQYAMEILSKHYETVYDEGRKGVWYYVRFVGPMVNECLTESKQREFTIFINDDLYCDEDGNPLYFDSYERAAEFIADNELHGGEVVRQAGKAAYEEGLDSDGKKFSNESYKDYNLSVSIQESNEHEEDQFLLYFPHIGGPKVVSKERAIKQLELELNTIKNESGASVAGRGFGLYCLQSIDSDTGTAWQGRYSSNEFLKVLNESDDNRAKEAFLNMFGDVEKQLEELTDKWEELKKKLEQQQSQVTNQLTEARNPYFRPYGYEAAKKVLNGTAPQYYWHVKEIEMDAGDGAKLAKYARKIGLPVVQDPNDDPDYPTFYILGKYHWNDYFYPYPSNWEPKLDEYTDHSIEEAVSAADNKEILRIAKEIGIHTASDLIQFYKDHPSFDEHKLETIQEYRNELGPDFEVKDEYLSEEIENKPSVIDRFMKGDITIIPIETIPENDNIEELTEINTDTCRYFYDSATDIIGCLDI